MIVSRWILVLCAGLFLLTNVHGQEAAVPAVRANSKKLTVLVKPAKPFVFERAGATVGYSIDLWRRVAEVAGLQFEAKTVATMPELIDGLKNQQADVGVGAISITAEREDVIDFTYPYYESGLQIMASVQRDSSIAGALKKLFTKENGLLLGGLVLALIAASHLLWLAERRRNEESFPGQYPQGVVEAAWWCICTGITGGCENKAPIGYGGRLLAIVWMLAGMALVASVTANLTTTMTVGNLVSDIQNLSDLQRTEVASVGGTAAADYLASHGYKVRAYPTVEAACEAVAAGEVKGAVYDAPLLRYFLTENPTNKLQLVGDVFEKQNYGFALQQNSPLRKEINRALLKLAEDGYLTELDRKWFAQTGGK